MDLANLLLPAAVGSIVLLVLSIGLSAPYGSVRAGLANRGSMSRAMLAMFVAMPAFTLLITWLLPLEPAARVALLAISVSPMPPILPQKQQKLGGETDYALAIMVLGCIAALLAAPVLIVVAGLLFGRSAGFDFAGALMPMLITVIVPLFLGIGLTKLLTPAAASRVAKLAKSAGTAVLLISLLALYAGAWSGIFAALRSPTLLAIGLMGVFGLAAGHWLGGPEAGNRRALAVATASRHPGVALGIAMGTTLVDQQPVVAVVLLQLVVALLLSFPYARWAQQRP